ncbi:hypothetical protein O3G_MSEX000492 [Manduca sexta]|nr:hypothetical protein O3G_MSEX000492 [Manduca sexta]
MVWSIKEIKEEIKEEIPVVNDEADDTVTEVNGTLDSTAEEEIKVEQKRVDLLRGDKKDLLMDDDEEQYVDLKIDEEGNVKPKKRKAPSATTPGWFHARVKTEAEVKNDDEEKEAVAKIQLKKTVNMDKVYYTIQ